MYAYITTKKSLKRSKMCSLKSCLRRNIFKINVLSHSKVIVKPGKIDFLTFLVNVSMVMIVESLLSACKIEGSTVDR